VCVCVCVFCRQFVEACGLGLGVNERLIKEDQQEYHDEMKANYRDLTKELSAIMHEPVRHTHTHTHTHVMSLSDVHALISPCFLFLFCCRGQIEW